MANCCEDFNYGCNELVTWKYLKDNMVEMYQSDRLYPFTSWADDYTPTYDEIYDLGVIAQQSSNYYGDRDGFIIDGSYDGSERVRKCDLYYQTTILDSISLTGYDSLNISECRYGFDLGVDCKFTRRTVYAYELTTTSSSYTWKTNNSFSSSDMFPGTVSTSTTGSFTSTCISSKVNCITQLTINVCKNPNTSTRTITINPSLSFKGETKTDTKTFTQYARTFGEYIQTTDATGYTATYVTVSPSNTSSATCGNAVWTASFKATISSYRNYLGYDTCGDRWSTYDYHESSPYTSTDVNANGGPSSITLNGCSIKNDCRSSGSDTFEIVGNYKDVDGNYIDNASVTVTNTPPTGCTSYGITGATTSSSKASMNGGTVKIADVSLGDCVNVSFTSNSTSNVDSIYRSGGSVYATLPNRSGCGSSTASTTVKYEFYNSCGQFTTGTVTVYQDANTSSCANCSDVTVTTTARTFSYNTRTAQNVASTSTTKTGASVVVKSKPDWITTGTSGSYITAAPNSDNPSRCENRSGTITFAYNYDGSEVCSSWSVTVTQQYNSLTITANPSSLTCDGGTVTFTVS